VSDVPRTGDGHGLGVEVDPFEADRIGRTARLQGRGIAVAPLVAVDDPNAVFGGDLAPSKQEIREQHRRMTGPCASVRKIAKSLLPRVKRAFPDCIHRRAAPSKPIIRRNHGNSAGTIVRVDEYHRDGLARVVAKGGRFVGSASDSGYITQSDLDNAVFLGKRDE
jgi:hypothetical protein